MKIRKSSEEKEILVLDASGAEGVCAVVRSGEVVKAIAFAGGRSRDCAVAETLAQLISEFPIAPARVVVGVGPGNYNGLRSSIAAAWGFAVARGIPLTGVSSWLALGEGEYLAAVDARQSQYGFARVKDGEFLAEPCLCDRVMLEEKLAAFPDLPVRCPAALGLPREETGPAQAHLLAQLSSTKEASMELPLPVYLKPPFVTT